MFWINPFRWDMRGSGKEGRYVEEISEGRKKKKRGWRG